MPAGHSTIVNPVHPHSSGDVLDLVLAKILKGEGEPVAHVVMHCIGDEHSAGLGQGFQPGRDIHPVAEKYRTPQRSRRRG